MYTLYIHYVTKKIRESYVKEYIYYCVVSTKYQRRFVSPCTIGK